MKGRRGLDSGEESNSDGDARRGKRGTSPRRPFSRQAAAELVDRLATPSDRIERLDTPGPYAVPAAPFASTRFPMRIRQSPRWPPPRPAPHDRIDCDYSATEPRAASVVFSSEPRFRGAYTVAAATDCYDVDAALRKTERRTFAATFASLQPSRRVRDGAAAPTSQPSSPRSPLLTRAASFGDRSMAAAPNRIRGGAFTKSTRDTMAGMLGGRPQSPGPIYNPSHDAVRPAVASGVFSTAPRVCRLGPPSGGGFDTQVSSTDASSHRNNASDEGHRADHGPSWGSDLAEQERKLSTWTRSPSPVFARSPSPTTMPFPCNELNCWNSRSQRTAMCAVGNETAEEVRQRRADYIAGRLPRAEPRPRLARKAVLARAGGNAATGASIGTRRAPDGSMASTAPTPTALGYALTNNAGGGSPQPAPTCETESSRHTMPKGVGASTAVNRCRGTCGAMLPKRAVNVGGVRLDEETNNGSAHLRRGSSSCGGESAAECGGVGACDLATTAVATELSMWWRAPFRATGTLEEKCLSGRGPQLSLQTLEASGLSTTDGTISDKAVAPRSLNLIRPVSAVGTAELPRVALLGRSRLVSAAATQAMEEARVAALGPINFSTTATVKKRFVGWGAAVRELRKA